MNTLALEIFPQENMLDGIVMYEPCDVVILDKLINSKLLRPTFNNKMSERYENERQQLMKYSKLFKNGMAEVKYTRHGLYGRSDPIGALGLYPIRREIRHTLKVDDSVDVDVKNCHPDIKLQICLANGIVCECLMDYVNNRQKYFDDTVRVYGCTEEEAKILYIVYLNGGEIGAWVFRKKIDVSKIIPGFKSTTSVLETKMNKSFREEQKKINEIIMEKNPHIKEEIIKKRKEQGKSLTDLGKSVCAIFLQEYEIRILEQVVKYCIEKEYIKDNVCVLCADGLMLEKRLVPDTLVTELEEMIFQKLGFRLVLTIKAMEKGYGKILDQNLKSEHIFDINIFHNITEGRNYQEDTSVLDGLKSQLDKFTALNKTNPALSKSIKLEEKEMQSRKDGYIYFKRKLYFEMFHCKFITPFSFGIKSRTCMEYMTRQTIMQCHENLKNGFMNLWMVDEKIRMYQNADFRPTPMKVESDIFNLYNGLIGEELCMQDNNEMIISQEELGRSSNIFIKQLWYLTGKNNAALEYCLNYLAHMVQKPGEIPRTALLVKGIQGIGKNIFFEKITEVLCGSEYLLSTDNLDDIVGKFSSINRKLMVILDEAKGKDTFTNSDSIKSFITAEKVRYERKGVDSIMIHNCVRMVFLTNNENAVKIEQSDRRFQAMEGSDDMANNTEYFTKLLSAFKNKVMVRNLYLFFKNRDITKVDMTNDRVITRLYREMKSTTIPSECKYFIAQVDILACDILKTAKDMHEEYCLWCEVKKVAPMSLNTFAKRLNGKDKILFIKKEITSLNQMYEIDKCELKKIIKNNEVDYSEIVTEVFPERYEEIVKL